MSNTSIQLMIREATPEDRARLLELAGRDSAPPLTGRILIGEAEGELRAAVAIDDGRAIADPFHGTADLRSLLEARARQLRGARRRRLRVAMRTASPVPLARRAAI